MKSISKLILTALPAALAFVASALCAMPIYAQTLASGIYEITGDIDDPVTRAPFTGSFTVLGGSVSELTITFADFFGPGSIYSGTSIAVVGGTWLNGTLTLTNPGSGNSAGGFLTLNSDGRFDCGGANIGSFSDTCALSQNAYGTDANEKTGNYSIRLVTPLEDPEPEVSEETVEAGQSTMLANRGALILGDTVNKQRRIDRLRNGSSVTREALSFGGATLLSDLPVGLSMDENRLNFAAGTDWGNAMLWAEGSIATLNDDASEDSRFGILHLGVDWLVSPDMMVGVSAQIDKFEQFDTGSSTDFSGVGWMVGPVMTARLAPNLYFNGRLAYGQADNDAERSGGEDNFDSERALAEISLTGEVTRGVYSIFPTAELSYFWEKSEAYTSSTYGPIAATEVALGQARLGTRIERPFEVVSGQSATGFVDFGAVYTDRFEGTFATGSFAKEIVGWSGDAEVGMNFTTKGGATVAASLGAGGLFVDSETYSAMLSITIPLK
ncbi:autotransporter outer membrane beta-barrel domain-containing protein [Sinirhodobacter sp. HNIBRBA609]|nr:autotransporter outer membrane beta-barrel domain-containing protein [Sinirhodobacter sp. HNIBRBA609]